MLILAQVALRLLCGMVNNESRQDVRDQRIEQLVHTNVENQGAVTGLSGSATLGWRVTSTQTASERPQVGWPVGSPVVS